MNAAPQSLPDTLRKLEWLMDPERFDVDMPRPFKFCNNVWLISPDSARYGDATANCEEDALMFRQHVFDQARDEVAAIPWC